jgi:AcrR family transcriptional regulator
MGMPAHRYKQIAAASRCTTAALYYYFPAGKAQLLRKVVHCSASLKADMVIQAGQEATSLDQRLRAFGHAAIQSFADSQGAVSVRLDTAGLAPGAYTLVARGNTSGLIAIGAFQVK